ncbi:MAG: sensor histidine kinase [Saprospiraceae bacterium]
MKRLKLLYIIPVLLSVLAAAILIDSFFTSENYWKAILVATIPALILAIGFRIITFRRIQLIRKQLFQILETLEEFDVDEPKKVEFEESPFPIFNDLNEYLIELIDRVRVNYQANKQFTQNASHELQTPLAVIKGHVEILLQSPRIGEKEIESLAAVLQNTNRLSKINSSLILLSKIEHQRFSDASNVNFEKVAEEVLDNFKDLISIQKIQIEKQYKGTFGVEMSETLAEILIANLVQNAIRHNIEEDGFIKIDIDENHFSISNSGTPPNMNTESLFKRFKRDSDVEESLGLGLSIVKRICEQAELGIQYKFSNGIHKLVIKSNRG